MTMSELTVAASRAGDWDALVATAITPGVLPGPVREVIEVFGCQLGFAERLADPAAAADQCITVSGVFAEMCHRRGIPAAIVTGFRFGQLPPFTGEVVLAGHTAVHFPAGLVVDWTARQFGFAPVPLAVPWVAWRAAWRNLAGLADE